jgi:hypothetical protein
MSRLAANATVRRRIGNLHVDGGRRRLALKLLVTSIRVNEMAFLFSNLPWIAIPCAEVLLE